MILSQLFDLEHRDTKTVLLYRFHIVTIVINIFAIFIDSYLKRYHNAFIEGMAVVLLFIGIWYLYRFERVKISAYFFIFVISLSLFTLIYINHFSTMSVVFVLLLPLTTFVFLPPKESFLLALLNFTVIALLLYLEYLNNPANPLVHNSQALFNLAYTAIIIYVFGLLYHFAIMRTFEELDNSNQQKALLLKEVHHRVKNNLNVIASIIGLQAAALDGREKEQLAKSKIRIESIAMVHEMLYRSDDLESIDFENYIRRLSALLLKMYGKQKNVNIDIQSSVRSLPLEVTVQLGIMANELLTNSIKYAFGTSDGEIQMNMLDDGDSYLFVYADNGRGVLDSEKLMKGNTLGIKLIKLTARQLGGNVTITSPKGLKYEIRFDHE